MFDFEIKGCSRQCAQTNRELKPGEPVYSVLVSRGAEIARLDYAADVWPGEPEGAIGWWKSLVPDANGPRINWAPNDVMLHYFEQLETRADQQDVRYVLTLLLIRRRIVRLEESQKNEHGQEVMIVYSPRGERQHRVLAEMPSDERIREIQNQLAKLLFDGSTVLPPLPAAEAVASPAVDLSIDSVETPGATT